MITINVDEIIWKVDNCKDLKVRTFKLEVLYIKTSKVSMYKTSTFKVLKLFLEHAKEV